MCELKNEHLSNKMLCVSDNNRIKTWNIISFWLNYYSNDITSGFSAASIVMPKTDLEWSINDAGECWCAAPEWASKLSVDQGANSLKQLLRWYVIAHCEFRKHLPDKCLPECHKLKNIFQINIGHYIMVFVALFWLNSSILWHTSTKVCMWWGR